MAVTPKQMATKGSQTVEYSGESANGKRVKKIPWAFWLPSSLLILVLCLSTIMLLVTVRTSPHNQCAAPHEKPIQSASEVRPLVRTRQTTPPTESTSDEILQTRIQEIYKRPGFSNPDPVPGDDYNEDATSDEVTTRHPRNRNSNRRRPVTEINENFDPNQSYVRKYPNGTIAYVFPKSVQTPSGTVNVTEKPNGDVTYRTSSSAKQHEILFPDELPTLDKQECPPDDPLCSNTPSYSDDEVDSIIRNHGLQFKEIFGNDVVIEDKLVSRSDFMDEEFLCNSQERLLHPKSGINQNNRNLTIVNTKEYMQGVRVELCRSTGKTCDNFTFGSVYKFECRQLYHYRTLLAIDPDTRKPYKELFRLPSCCKCVRISSSALLRERRNADDP